MGRPASVKVGDNRKNLHVVEVLSGRGAGKHAKVKVQCACGNTSIMTTQIYKKSNSCGCDRRDSSTWKRSGPKRMPWQLPKGEAAMNELYGIYQRGAIKRNLTFEISRENFVKIVYSDCHYCGAKPSRRFGQKKCNGNILCNGVDRIDSSLGYSLENCVPACKSCNLSKNNRSYKEFIMHAKSIIEHQKSIGNPLVCVS